MEQKDLQCTKAEKAVDEAGVEPSMTHSGGGVEEAVRCGSGEKSGLKV